MKRKYLHIAMFRAMDCRYDEMENPPEILSAFLTDANPYIWADHTTADPVLHVHDYSAPGIQNRGKARLITEEELKKYRKFLERVFTSKK